MKCKTEAKTRALVFYLRKNTSMSAREICGEAGISRSTLYRLLKLPAKVKQASKMGRPRKISVHKDRIIRRSIGKLRTTEGSFSTKTLMQEAVLVEPGVSKGTITRCLHTSSFKLEEKADWATDLNSDRFKFARKMKRNFKDSIWTEEISFYLDGVSFVHKFNPCEQARAPKGHVWRKSCEGLDPSCTAKGSHVGTGGRLVKIFVAISYGQGVICCKQYEQLNGEFFKAFISAKCDAMFRKGKKASGLFVQDADPSQNWSKAKAAMKAVGANILPIPPRSPDLNPIENIFHLVKRKVNSDELDLQIMRENMNDFAETVKNTFLQMDKGIIVNIISSMPKRLDLILQNHGRCTKY